MNKLLTKTILLLSCIVLVLSLASCATGSTNTTVEAEEVPEAVAVSNEKPESGVSSRVYFAAPMFAQSEKEYNLKLVHILEEYGYEVFLPQRDGIEAALLEGKTQEELVEIVFAKDLTEIQKADVIFFLVDGRVPDEGACVELGIGYALGKRCYGFMTDTRSLERVLDLNPIISGCFIKLFKDFDGDKLIGELRQYLSENEL